MESGDRKYTFEFAKHLTTLDTAAILLLVALVDRFEEFPGSRRVLIIAFSGLCISFVGSVMALYFLLFVRSTEIANWGKSRFGVGIGLMLGIGGLIFGIGDLIMFVMTATGLVAHP